MLRKAKITDANDIYNLIHWWAKKRKVLNRSLNYIYENIRDFWVYELNGKIIGCCGLHCMGWDGLGEIKSLIVAKDQQKKGIGRKLVNQCVKEAKELGLKKVFALTFVPGFFRNLKFKDIERKELHHKIWADCIDCIYFPDCREEALILEL